MMYTTVCACRHLQQSQLHRYELLNLYAKYDLPLPSWLFMVFILSTVSECQCECAMQSWRRPSSNGSMESLY